MPKAIEKMRTVEGFTGMPNQPMMPAVMISGSKLGKMATTIIRHERNSPAMSSEITTTAKIKLMIRLSMRYSVERKKIKPAPEKLTSTCSRLKMASALA